MDQYLKVSGVAINVKAALVRKINLAKNNKIIQIG